MKMSITKDLGIRFETFAQKISDKGKTGIRLPLKAKDATGVEVEKWTLEQCMITAIDFGENSYEEDGLTTIALTIQPWRCILNM